MEPTKDALLQAALARALVDAVSPEIQREVFKEAISNFLFRVDDHGKGILKDSFERALKDAVGMIAREIVATPEYRKKMDAMMHVAMDEALKEEAFVKVIKDRLVRAVGW